MMNVEDLIREFGEATEAMNQLQVQLKAHHDRRAQLVWQVREAGLTHREIATRVGLSNARVWQLINAHEETLEVY